MGKLADAIKEYKISPSNSPREREAKEIISNITESQWWKDNVGKEFKWPRKANDGKAAYKFGCDDNGITGPYYYFQNVESPNIYEVTSKPESLLTNPEWLLVDEKP